MVSAGQSPVVRITWGLPTATPQPYNDATQCILRIRQSCERGIIAAFWRPDFATLRKFSKQHNLQAPRNLQMTVTPTIVGLGEVLWDVFPDGPRFGGAPANFACSAAGVGGETVHVSMVSAVGHDALGRRALQTLIEHAVGVQYVDQMEFQTGQVVVSLDNLGRATYNFAANTAWDHLEWRAGLETLAERTDAVCFGTLGQRSQLSATTIERFVSSTPLTSLRVFDVNLRPPFWTAEAVLRSLELANILKLNDEELPVIAGLLKIDGDSENILRQLMERYALKLAALTRGANGSLLLSESGEISDLPGKPTKVVDTVGAGDAFTAAMIVGLLTNRTLSDLHHWAAEVAAYVCSHAGATPRLPSYLKLQNR